MDLMAVVPSKATKMTQSGINQFRIPLFEQAAGEIK
jgi:hypothetical protein